VNEDLEGDAAVGIADERDSAVGIHVAFDKLRLKGNLVQKRDDARGQILNVDRYGVDERRRALVGLLGIDAELFTEQVETGVLSIQGGIGRVGDEYAGDLRTLSIDKDLNLRGRGRHVAGEVLSGGNDVPDTIFCWEELWIIQIHDRVHFPLA